LRRAFELFDNNGKSLLPSNILWRRKEAFSDGVSKVSRSLFTIIQEHVDKLEFPSHNNITHNPPTTNEQRFYRNLYDTFYPNMAELVPYFWMPKWVKTIDASARTLSIY